MPRPLYKLTVKKIKVLSSVGRYSDGGGLYLHVRKTGSKYWIFKFKKNNKVTEKGIGSLEMVSLCEARDQARIYRERLHAGEPLDEIEEVKVRERTFLECLEDYLATKEVVWKNDKHRAQWHMTLKVYARPLHKLNVNHIKTPHVLKVLKPIWLNKNETASRTRARIEAVIDYAKAMGWKTGDNPAVMKGNLGLLLPAYSRAKNIKHHKALEFEEMPKFLSNLRQREAFVARLLEFIILTASRSGEARFATWSEMDFEKGLWTLSADRMKMSKEHVVPLSKSAITLLNNIKLIFPYAPHDLVFPNPRNMKPFSINATRALLKRMSDENLTTHGFRSTFRDWAGDKTYHRREIIEAALAHRLKDKAEAAYRRSTALEKRKQLMQDWDNYCTYGVLPQVSNVNDQLALVEKINQLEAKIKSMEAAA